MPRRSTNPTPLDGRLLVTVPEAARLLGCGVERVRWLVKHSYLPTVELGDGERSRAWRIPVAALRAFVERQSRPVVRPVVLRPVRAYTRRAAK